MREITWKQIIYAVLILAVICATFFTYEHYKKNNISRIGDVAVKYIDVKAKLLAVARGHYLSEDDLGLYYDGKLILDSKILGKGGQLDNYSLSDNGLHYTFVVTHYIVPTVMTTAVHDLYVDGKKVESISYPSVDYPFGSHFDHIFITNDGKDYFYLRDNQNQASLPQNNTIDLIKNGKSIFNFSKASSLNRLIVSQDGLNTLLVYGTGKEINDPGMYIDVSAYSISLNNKEISKTSTKSEVMPYTALSPNGKHYALIKDTKLFIDGEPRMPDKSIVLDGTRQLQITDSGHYMLTYYVLDNSTVKMLIYIDDKEYISQISALYINDDASHRLVFDNMNGWLLDDKPISFQGEKFFPFVEYNNYQPNGSIIMQGDTIYAYKSDPTFDYYK